MIGILKRVFSNIYRMLYCKLYPVKYARSLGVKVGENVRIYGANHHMFSTEPWLISIGNNVHITADVVFLTHDGGTLIIDRADLPYYVLTGDIEIGDNTYIGTRTIILPGVKIGSRCVIGAGSVVTKDIPDNSVAAGVPAKVISSIEQYIEKMKGAMRGENPRYYADPEYVVSLNPRRKSKRK